MSDAILFQNGRHVCLGDVVRKGTVTEDDLRISRWLQLLVPIGNTLGEGFDLSLVDGFVQTSKENAISDGVDRLTCDILLFNRDGQIDASFEQKLDTRKNLADFAVV